MQFNYAAVSCFPTRPSANTRYLIARQLPKLIDIAISDALQFINTAQTKERALKQLKYTVLIGEDAIDVHLEKIMRALVKLWQMEIEGAEKIIQEIMVIVGYHLKSDFYLPLMFSLLQSDEIRNSPKNTVILLKLIAYMLQKTEDIANHLPQLIKLVKTYEAQMLDNDDGLATVSQIAINLIRRLPSFDQPQLVSTLFSVLLNVQATNSIPAAHQAEVKEAMQLLATRAGFQTVALLHSFQIGPVLQNLMDSREYTQWGKTSKNRFKFDTIVRNCEGQAIKFLPNILTVMEYCISLDCNIEIRMDTLVLLETMLENPQVREALKLYSSRVMTNLLANAIKWKVGNPQIKIRKAGVINMIRMIEQEVITPEQLLQGYGTFMPQITSCISDNWAPELRLACCEFMEQFLSYTREFISWDQLTELYEILLARLDDSQNPIRIKATVALNLFFLCKCLPPGEKSSIPKYMITSIFVHFDDNKKDIRDAINITLRYAARTYPEQVLENAEINLKRMKNPEHCEELVVYCKEVIEEKKI